MTKLERAMLVAEKVHMNQSYDIFPYIYHIKQVVKVAQNFGFDSSIQEACALHDSMEDGNLSYNDIKKYFGEEVAELVYAVTDELGRNRKERKAKTYPKIRSNWKAVAVKLCDRIANMQHSSEYTPDMMNMYKKEHDGFKTALYNPDHPENELKKLWEQIEVILNSIK
jgi:(p)ppGpp synthase/HD superfamily hydrolase